MGTHFRDLFAWDWLQELIQPHPRDLFQRFKIFYKTIIDVGINLQLFKYSLFIQLNVISTILLPPCGAAVQNCIIVNVANIIATSFILLRILNNLLNKSVCGMHVQF